MTSVVSAVGRSALLRAMYAVKQVVKFRSVDAAPCRKKRRSSKLLFLRELCKNPRSMGAVCPSSPHLARRMAASIPEGQGLIVELGAGTGEVTRALAEVVQEVQRLWAVEQSPVLAARLAEKLPQVTVVPGDARELARLVPEGKAVDAIISCLPLRAFSRKDVEAITEQWAKVLSPEGIVVQFTYALWGADTLKKQGFYEVAHSVVWKNVPPARVQILKKTPS